MSNGNLKAARYNTHHFSMLKFDSNGLLLLLPVYTELICLWDVGGSPTILC
jgi:hypothetical protein